MMIKGTWILVVLIICERKCSSYSFEVTLLLQGFLRMLIFINDNYSANSCSFEIYKTHVMWVSLILFYIYTRIQSVPCVMQYVSTIVMYGSIWEKKMPLIWEFFRIWCGWSIYLSLVSWLGITPWLITDAHQKALSSIVISVSGTTFSRERVCLFSH